jgi:Spy/CpxP family protein refolding chaperone
METSADLLPVLEWNRGDPRLTAWEEGFLVSMVQQIRAFHGAAKISRKQWDKIHAIMEKVEQPPEEAAEEETAEMEG